MHGYSNCKVSLNSSVQTVEVHVTLQIRRSIRGGGMEFQINVDDLEELGIKRLPLFPDSASVRVLLQYREQ